MDVLYGCGRFPTTHWSLVGRAGQDATENKRQAVGELLNRYLPALRAQSAYHRQSRWITFDLVYGKRLAPEDADDLLQEFIATKILPKADTLIGRQSGSHRRSPPPMHRNRKQRRSHQSFDFCRTLRNLECSHNFRCKRSKLPSTRGARGFMTRPRDGLSRS